MCRFAYGPADAIATDCLLLQEIQIGLGFTFLMLAYPGSPGQSPRGPSNGCSSSCYERKHLEIKGTGLLQAICPSFHPANAINYSTEGNTWPDNKPKGNDESDI